VSHAKQARRVLRTTWLIAIFIVVVGSLLPGDSVPITALNRLNINDKIEHFGAYALLAFLPTIHERWRFIIAAAIGAVVLGIVLEFGQLYLGWRDFEVGDMVADALGVGFGLLVGVPIRSIEILRRFAPVPQTDD
jgi:VanZ family protein